MQNIRRNIFLYMKGVFNNIFYLLKTMIDLPSTLLYYVFILNLKVCLNFIIQLFVDWLIPVYLMSHMHSNPFFN